MSNTACTQTHGTHIPTPQIITLRTLHKNEHSTHKKIRFNTPIPVTMPASALRSLG